MRHEGTLYKNKNNQWVYDDEFIQWLQRESMKYPGVADLAKGVKLSEYIINKIQIESHLCFDYNKNDPRYNAIYQDYDWCYQKYIVEGLSQREMSDEAKCSLRVLKKWLVEKHRLTSQVRKKIMELTPKQKDLIIGSLLGDGHITNENYSPIFIVAHANNQKGYLYWKYEIIKNLCNEKPTRVDGSLKTFGGKKGNSYVQDNYRINTRVLDCLIPYRDMSIIELLDNLNEFSLSIWMLDDGSREESNWSICVARFSEDEKLYAINSLKSKLNLDGYIVKSDTRYIRFNSVNTRKIDRAILNNIPNDLDIIKYKITEKPDKTEPEKRLILNVEGKDMLLVDYCRLKEMCYREGYKKYRSLARVGTLDELEI